MTEADHPWLALEAAARRWPDAEALVFPHQKARLSFRQYRDDALALAGALAAQGLSRGDHIALLAENRSRMGHRADGLRGARGGVRAAQHALPQG